MKKRCAYNVYTISLKDPGLLPNKRTRGGGGGGLLSQLIVADFLRDEIFCKYMNFKNVQAFWLELPEFQGAPKNRFFSGPYFFTFDSKSFFCIDFLG